MTGTPSDDAAASPPSVKWQFARFLLVGPVGVVLGMLQYELLWQLNRLDAYRASSTWIVSSVLGIAWVHALHCRFTFRGPGSARWGDTIGRAYLLYASTVAIGSWLMWLLVDEMSVRRASAWLLTTAVTSVLNFVLLRRLLVHRPSAGNSPGFPLDEVTIVVPTKNERHNVPAFLASVPDELMLIVVDASSDGTMERIRELRPERTQLIRCNGHIAAARQRGAEAARTPWLLFTDVDVSFAPGYFELLASLRLPPACAGIVGGKRSVDRFGGYYRAFLVGQRLLQWFGIPAATGSNMLVRRDALLACGGFDRQLRVNEDSELMWRCQRAGHAVHFAPELVVHERDYRRLERGVVRKLLHTTLRCVALYLGVLPERWRLSDWGYWRPRPSRDEVVAEG
jgi:putative flippase GtrA